MRLLASLLIILISVATTAAAPPNILVIYSDDHGWADLGVQGVNAEIRTPHLDALARDGIRCTRGYVSAPQCVPSRAAVLTGRYQQRFGLEDNTKGALPLEEITIAERLKPAGYVSGQIGKWHLDLEGAGKGLGRKQGVLTAHAPHGQGFDEYFRGELLRYTASHALDGQPFADAPHALSDPRFRCVVQTDAALSFLDRRAQKPEQPWFLYLAYFTPHVPLESPEPWFSKTPTHLPQERRQALAMMAAMDEGIGAIRAKLQATGQEQKTLIFFIGDNGAVTKAGHWDGSLNTPLVGEKGMLTDGGIRVPFLVTWPGTLPAGRTYDHPVSNLDVAATANALAGLPSDPRLDGVNLIPFLSGKKDTPPHEALYWRWRSQAAVLEFPWKLIRLGPDEQMLFDVTHPEGEKKNVLREHPQLVERLNARLTQWSQQLSPPGLPTETNAQDALFFAEHVDPRFAALSPKRAAPAPASKPTWICRNGTLAPRDGVLLVTPEAGAKAPFLAITGIDVAGPARLTVRARGGTPGSGSVSWRTTKEKDFAPENRVPLAWTTAAGEWRDLTAQIASKERLIHLRILTPGGTQPWEIERITLEPEGKPATVWDFRQP